MLRITKNMKEKYEKIQNYIFSLIPEKWDEIYLYASVIENEDSKQKGELFFYYVPKGILRKRAINVYEVPSRFNINEEQYMNIVEDLYKTIKELKQDFIDTEQEAWTNLTISIANFKFKIEFNYDELPFTEEEIQKRNVIWMYKYLKVGGDTKEERAILDEYYLNAPKTKTEFYETGLYLKTEKNTITFDKEQNGDIQFVIYEKDDIANILSKTKNKITNSIGIKKTKENEKEKENENEQSKNQILNN